MKYKLCDITSQTSLSLKIDLKLSIPIKLFFINVKNPLVRLTRDIPVQFVKLINRDIKIGKNENKNRPIKLGNRNGNAFFHPVLPFDNIIDS
jgi:hypothetical protein